MMREPQRRGSPGAPGGGSGSMAAQKKQRVIRCFFVAVMRGSSFLLPAAAPLWFPSSRVVVVLIVSGDHAGQTEHQRQAERCKTGGDEEDGLIIADAQPVEFPMNGEETSAQQETAGDPSGGQSELEICLTECGCHGCVSGSRKGEHFAGGACIEHCPDEIAEEKQNAKNDE